MNRSQLAEKQTPKPPVYDGPHGYHCPGCGKYLPIRKEEKPDNGYTYCPYCRQKIDWNVEMRYRVDVWQHHAKVDSFSSESPFEIVQWYKENWETADEYGDCCHYIFINDEKLDNLTAMIEFEHKYSKYD